MAENVEGVVNVAKAALENNVLLQICHPLRYTVFYNKIKELLEQEVLGKVIFIDMVENVGYWHLWA